MKISYFTKIVGVSFEGRQDTIGEMNTNSRLRFRREPNNEYDSNAVAVDALISGEWKPIGYIAKDKNSSLAKELDAGNQVKVTLSDVTGGVDGKAFGVNIAVEYTQRGDIELEKLIPDIGTGYVMFDSVNHVYFDEQGNQMISGSRYEQAHSPEMDFSYAAKAMAKTTGIKPDRILDLWGENRDLSADYGTVIHKGLEVYFKNHELMKQLDAQKERPHTAMTYMPQAVGNIVDEYIARYDVTFAQRCSAELFVRYENRCGFIDLTESLEQPNVVNTHDYKFIKKLKRVKYAKYGDLNKYTLQQNFYREILEANGYTVNQMFLDTYVDGTWETEPVKRIKLEY